MQVLVDVRSFPGSRRHPQFGQEALARSLEAAGVDYRWERDLGGFRKPRPDSPHTALRSEGFRGYADHMQTTEFETALARVLRGAESRRVAVMCAESLWWRCHRRMLADAVLARGWEVLHLLPDGGLQTHRLSAAARMVGGRLVYDVPEGQLELAPPPPGT